MGACLLFVAHRPCPPDGAVWVQASLRGGAAEGACGGNSDYGFTSGYGLWIMGYELI